ncbi:hypothetical protein GCM10011396_49570 [Undibacterium terreum]|uniref:Uncharacterized protein n=1 Tax=Undibacterium terreum TaxID=1224302 RepID=A0A916V0F5_9BURK|nr:hypothetical protein GCM10011396_49570 [Undibacterium terreum]
MEAIKVPDTEYENSVQPITSAGPIVQSVSGKCDMQGRKRGANATGEFSLSTGFHGFLHFAIVPGSTDMLAD